VRVKNVIVKAIMSQAIANAVRIKTVHRSGIPLIGGSFFCNQSNPLFSLETRKPEKKVAIAELTIEKRLSS
jgi:hypothetical protein